MNPESMNPESMNPESMNPESMNTGLWKMDSGFTATRARE